MLARTGGPVTLAACMRRARTTSRAFCALVWCRATSSLWRSLLRALFRACSVSRALCLSRALSLARSRSFAWRSVAHSVSLAPSLFFRPSHALRHSRDLARLVAVKVVDVLSPPHVYKDGGVWEVSTACGDQSKVFFCECASMALRSISKRRAHTLL